MDDRYADATASARAWQTHPFDFFAFYRVVGSTVAEDTTRARGTHQRVEGMSRNFQTHFLDWEI
jgi:hypothetical protein